MRTIRTPLVAALKKHLKDEKVTLPQVAKATGVTHPTLYKLVNHNHNITTDNYDKIKNYLEANKIDVWI